ncbi:MAG: FAD-dependent oxidoreductase [Cyclobacteriaceae bacterium]|nr:FAD-dependent oxidoreductase [Cyclobacteriaceae bacterium]
MKRRKAIKKIGLGLSAGLALPWLSSCKPDDPGPEISYDGIVGIIGAGAAGLLAADILMAKGVKVKIFEASDQVGGRVRTFRRSDVSSGSLTVFPGALPFSDFPLELGADKIIGTDSKWAEIVKLMRIPLVDFRSTSTDSYIIDGLYATAEEAMQDVDFVTAQNFRDTFASFSGAPNTTVWQAAQTAGVASRMQTITNSWLGNRYGSSIDRIGANALAEAIALVQHDDREFTSSNNPLQDILLSRYVRAVSVIQFNTKVQSINHSGEKVEISHSGGTDTVDKLIVTVPVSVLKAGDIAFSPALPGSKASALSRIGMDASIRLILEFNRNFYGEALAALLGGVEGPDYLNAAVGRSDLNRTLAITINGAQAEQLSTLPVNQAVQQVLSEMDTVFGGSRATDNIRRDLADNSMVYTMKDWTKDPLFKGGNSYPLPGGTNADRTALAEPVGDKLFFAGEATDDVGEFGTVSGALNSGERAAFQVIEAILA